MIKFRIDSCTIKRGTPKVEICYLSATKCENTCIYIGPSDKVRSLEKPFQNVYEMLTHLLTCRNSCGVGTFEKG